ncbi:MAG: VCBS repeat-containing protein [Gemmatimonadota bacterium]|nr:VCBS repeat-containing protein [Gemmatimonadota bacterium]
MDANRGSVGLKIDKLKDMHLETVLAAGGQPGGKIVIGDGASQQHLADRIVERIEETTGARLPVVRANEVSAAKALLDTHVVALGNMADNPFIRWLYYQWWSIEDLCYPGAGGYALRTLHNLLGNGRNAVLLGVSDEAGLDRAASRFLKGVGTDTRLSFGWLMDVEPGPAFKSVEHPPDGWLDERREDYNRQVSQPHASKAGAGHGMVTEAGRQGFAYHRTGFEVHAKALREAVDAHLKMGEHGVMAHFNVWWLAVIWDLIEESPVFSDEDRLRITRYLLWLMDSHEGAYNRFFREGVGHRMVRQNHQTLVGLSSWFAGRYFATHYRMPEAREWQAASADLFQGQAASFKPTEDANAYQWTTLDHLLTYTLASGDETYIENGNCRRSLDQAVMYCNNRGAMPPFGDSGGCQVPPPASFLAKAGHVLRDGRAEFLIRSHSDRVSLIHGFEKYYGDGLEPETPSEMAGVRVLEVADGFYDFATDPKARPSEVKPLNLPRDEAFDTVCFREGFDRDDQYLMIHGISYGNHGHDDGNTIVEFSASDRVFLVDASYTEGPTLKHHNGVTAVRNGEPWKVPALCRLDGVADLDRTGVSRTSMDGEWGARWTRNVVWLKGRFFVVIDEIKATEPGTFALECNWRTLGTPVLDGGRLETLQRDPDSGREDRFILEGTGGDRVTMERDWEAFGHWWKDYPFSDDFVNILRQSVSREMAAGDRHTFINLFYATNDAKPLDVRMRRVGETAVLIEGSEGRMLVGTGGADGSFAVGPISGSADVYAIGEGWFAVLGGTLLRGDATLFESDAPVTVELDLASGEGVPTALWRLPEWRPGGGSAIHKGSAPSLRPAWSHDFGSAVRCAAPRGSGSILGTQDGRVVALSRDGETDWTFQAGDAVLSVCAAGRDGDDRAPVAAGANDRCLYYLDDKGDVKWSHTFEIFRGGWAWYTRNSSVELVKAADLRGTGRPDILAAVTDRQLHCFDADGNKRWNFFIYGIFDPFCLADVDGDGLPEVIGGPGRISCGGTCYVLDADGNAIAENGLDGWPSMLPGCDVYLYENGDNLIACGTTRSRVHALRLEGQSLAPVWTRDVGEEVHAVAAVDLDGDGKPEVAAGSDCFYLYLFDENGVERWRRNLEAPVRRLVATDVNQDGTPEIVAGCEDGSVWILDAEGRTLGLHRSNTKTHALTPHEGGRLLLGCSDGTLSMLGL